MWICRLAAAAAGGDVV